MGGITNLKLHLDHNKNEFLIRNKNFTALNNYNESDTLDSTKPSISRNKGLTSIKTSEDLEKLLIEKMNQTKKKSPKNQSGFKYSFSGGFDKSFPNFADSSSKNRPNMAAAHRTARIDPLLTSHKPYGFNIEEDVEGIRTL